MMFISLGTVSAAVDTVVMMMVVNINGRRSNIVVTLAVMTSNIRV